MVTKINLLTGQRPSLSESRKFKAQGIYNKLVVSESDYRQFSNMTEEHQKEKIDKILGRNKVKEDDDKVSAKKQKKIIKKKRYQNERRNNNNIKQLKEVMTDEKLKNKDGNILFEVVGIHSRGFERLEPRLNEYHFRADSHTHKLKYLQVGAIAVVMTKFGLKRIIITNVIKPRSENRMEEVRKFMPVKRIVPETWLKTVKTLKRVGKIKG